MIRILFSSIYNILFSFALLCMFSILSTPKWNSNLITLHSTPKTDSLSSCFNLVLLKNHYPIIRFFFFFVKLFCIQFLLTTTFPVFGKHRRFYSQILRYFTAIQSRILKGFTQLFTHFKDVSFSVIQTTASKYLAKRGRYFLQSPKAK